MSTYVLVHAAQSGGWAWKFVVEKLYAAGHRVWAPSLTGLGDRVHLARPETDLDTHITDITNLIKFQDLNDVILVGWSYGGMVATGVADRVPEKLAHVVYLDAEVPQDGESLFDLNGPEFQEEMESSAQLNGNGWLASFGSEDELYEMEREWIPDDELRRWYVSKVVATPQPIETYRQAISLSNPKADALPRTFFRLPVDGEAFSFLFDPIAERFRNNPHWHYAEIATNHCGPLVAPTLVAKSMMKVTI